MLASKLKTEGLYDEARHDNWMLARFARARKYDGEKTWKMLLDYENWRREVNVEKIVHEFAFPEDGEISKLYPRYYHKTDKAGRPIYIERLELVDCKKLFEITTQERLLTRYIREYEKLLGYRFAACSVKENRRVEQGTTIIDLKGVPLSQFNQVRKLVGSVSSIAQNYYPETMGRMFIINAPTLFTAIWAIVRQMLDEATVAKISVLGSGYKKELLEVIAPENLQVAFGGTCTLPPGDLGPWNDGSIPGFPIALWEDMKIRDGY